MDEGQLLENGFLSGLVNTAAQPRKNFRKFFVARATAFLMPAMPVTGFVAYSSR